MNQGNRLHINKFSGQSFLDGLLQSEYIVGKFELQIDCLENPSKYQPYLAVVLRDLYQKNCNIGADFGIGKGLIEIDDVQIINGE